MVYFYQYHCLWIIKSVKFSFNFLFITQLRFYRIQLYIITSIFVDSLNYYSKSGKQNSQTVINSIIAHL